MTTHTYTPKTTYTVEQLTEMNDLDFDEAVTEDLRYVAQFKGPFQQPELADRTLHALLQKLWFADSRIQIQAEDPNVSPEQYRRTVGFRNHLIGVIDVTERRVNRLRSRDARESAEWKALLHDVLEELEGGPEEDILDEFEIPYADGMNLRTWLEVRRVKDPSRIKVKEGVAA